MPAPQTTSGTRRLLAVAVGAVLVAAVVGLVLLWPTGPREPLAAELGLDAVLVDATVLATDVGPCDGTPDDAGILCDLISLRVTEGVTKGDETEIEIPITEAAAALDEGDGVILAWQPELQPPFEYRFFDFQRETPLLWLWGLFVLAVVALGRWQGLRALVGLIVTGVVMIAFLFPSILDGNDPTAAALVAAAVIGVAALYLTHGVSERTTVALLGTFAALGLTAILAAVFAGAAHFTGFSSEDAYYLQVAATQVDVRGLVLAGIIIGSLGVLDDVTVTQVSAVWQLHLVNPAIGVRELYRSAVVIGCDHIASTVNTLVLAYAGASLPLLLVYTQAGRPLTDVATGEIVAVEIVRTLVGSIGLVAAVPMTTALAAIVITRGAAPTPQPAVGGGAEPDAPPTPPEASVPTAAATSDDDDGEEEEGWERFAPEDAEPW